VEGLTFGACVSGDEEGEFNGKVSSNMGLNSCMRPNMLFSIFATASPLHPLKIIIDKTLIDIKVLTRNRQKTTVDSMVRGDRMTG